MYKDYPSSCNNHAKSSRQASRSGYNWGKTHHSPTRTLGPSPTSWASSLTASPGLSLSFGSCRTEEPSTFFVRLLESGTIVKLSWETYPRQSPYMGLLSAQCLWIYIRARAQAMPRRWESGIGWSMGTSKPCSLIGTFRVSASAFALHILSEQIHSGRKAGRLYIDSGASHACMCGLGWGVVCPQWHCHVWSCLSFLQEPSGQGINDLASSYQKEEGRSLKCRD